MKNLKALRNLLNSIEKSTPWAEIAKESSVEKQIEIRAEIKRAIKRTEKEIK